MTFTAEILHPTDNDAPPMWESSDHPDHEAAFQSALTYVHATQPHDRFVAAGHGVYAILAGSARVGVLVITPTDDAPHAGHHSGARLTDDE